MSHMVPNTVGCIIKWKNANKRIDDEMKWPHSVELCNDNSEYTESNSANNYQTDVLYSFLGIYAIGVWVYNKDKNSDNVFKINKNKIMTINKNKNTYNQILCSLKFITELQDTKLNGIDITELNKFLDNTFSRVYFDVGNLTPIWPGGNREKGNQNNGYMDIPELFFYKNEIWLRLLKNYPRSFLDGIHYNSKNPKFKSLDCFLKSVNTVEKYNEYINYLVSMINARSKLIKNDNKELMQSFEKFNDTLNLLELLHENASRKIKVRISKESNYVMCGQSLESSISTLGSVLLCLKEGHVSDAGVLTRKLRDDLLQYLFVLETMSSTQGLTKIEIDNYFDKGVDGILDSVRELYYIHKTGSRKLDIDKAIDSWFDNTLKQADSTKYRRNYFDASKYIYYLKKNKYIGNLFDLYIEKQWISLDRKLNNYVHSNGSEYIHKNLPYFTKDKYKLHVYDISEMVVNITALFLCMYILIEPSCIQSRDFADYLDAGLKPPKGCECWVEGVASYYINEYVCKLHIDLKEFLVKNNGFGMLI